MDIAGNTVLTVTQINHQAKYTLEKSFSHIWVQGEISSFKRYPSGHVYLTLKDNQSELSAVIFNRNAEILQHSFEAGQKVVAFGNLSIYSGRGQYQFLIENLYPVGQGELWLKLAALKRKLAAEGLFDPAIKKQLPRFPAKIGIITSSEGAALQDIIQVITRLAPHIRCLLHPVPVQGSQAASKIASAIAALNEYGGIDLIIVGRGGGSLEDLWCFNEEIVARAIFESEIPIVSAVGHETDSTIADFAADLRAATPSAAAEIISPSREDLLQTLDVLLGRSAEIIIRRFKQLKERFEQLQKRHGIYKPQGLIQKWQIQLNNNKQRIISLVKNRQNLELIKVNHWEKELKLLNPKAQLSRGYAIVLNEKKQLISSSDQVHFDEMLAVHLGHGVISTKVVRKVK